MRPPPLVPSVEPHRGPQSVALGGKDACEHCHWGLRWGSPWGYNTLYWVGETHANTTTGAFSGASRGATKWCSV
eukprot:9491178-Pyramimonas_sp.AAC.1